MKRDVHGHAPRPPASSEDVLVESSSGDAQPARLAIVVKDPVALKLAADLKAYRAHASAIARPPGAPGLPRPLVPGELESISATLDVVAARPARFMSCTDGVHEVPFDLEAARALIEQYAPLELVHAQLTATIARVESDMIGLAMMMHVSSASTFDTAKDAAKKDVTAARLLAPALAFRAAPAATREANAKEQRLLEANMSSVELANLRIEQAKEHADDETAKQARRAARASKKKK